MNPEQLAKRLEELARMAGAASSSQRLDLELAATMLRQLASKDAVIAELRSENQHLQKSILNREGSNND